MTLSSVAHHLPSPLTSASSLATATAAVEAPALPARAPTPSPTPAQPTTLFEGAIAGVAARMSVCPLLLLIGNDESHCKAIQRK